MTIGFPKPKRPARVTAAEFRQAWKDTFGRDNNGRKTKFGNSHDKADQKCPFPTDSGLEREFYLEELRVREMAGEIREIERQPQVWFEVNGVRFGYKPDWAYFDVRLGMRIWVELKGDATARSQTWNQNQKLWRAVGPGPLRVVHGTKRGWRTVKVITPNRRQTHEDAPGIESERLDVETDGQLWNGPIAGKSKT